MKNHIEFKDTDAQFTMIAIEGNIEGEPFEMGGDGYEMHKVKLNNFWMGEYPVTQALWETIMGFNPSRFLGNIRPVENVSWEDVQLFIKELNGKTDISYRLPTEAEWEYAAKGGKYWKDYPSKFAGSDKLNEVSWHNEKSHGETKPVGLKTPNLLGLYDMSGNVWEWCEDWYSSDFYKACQQQDIVVNPCNSKQEGRNRVYRGGSWINIARHCRPSNRSGDTMTNRRNDIGFRLVFSFSSV